ncbi:hypothetical protein NS14008_38410 [Nocardia seriolae]|uniref:DUF190 domain-containing protein n=1 Tax=Nocardia seriolae TaxID=37332 RepID=UPI0008FF50EA|nr:DUF190 domain-containing protein [Nocardia seriolae]OJF77880.1 hypothetical protein NS14008_38410 [Nocardia seriolae]
MDLAERLPVLVMIIDDTARLRAFVENNADLLDSVTVALSPVEVFDGVRSDGITGGSRGGPSIR